MTKKNIIYVSLLFISMIFLSCYSGDSNTFTSQDVIVNQKSNCLNSCFIKSTEICLPELDDWINIIKGGEINPNFIKHKELINSFKAQNNDLLAFYARESSDDYAAIFVHEQAKDDINLAQFKQVTKTMSSKLNNKYFMQDVNLLNS